MNAIKKSLIRGLSENVESDFSGNTVGDFDGIKRSDAVVTSERRKHELGIPEEAVIEEYEATSTYTNATESLRLMDEYNFDSALVVTSDYHLKRSKMIFDRVSGGEHTLIYIAAYGPNGEAWHERDFTWRIWWSEFCKMWGYRLGLYQFVDLRDAADGVE